MKAKTETTASEFESNQARTIKIFGVGGAGVSLLDTLNSEEFAGAGFVAINTDAPSLAASAAPMKIHLETKLLRGLGTGGDPERGTRNCRGTIFHVENRLRRRGTWF